MSDNRDEKQIDEETEGHAAKYRGALPEDDATEGHMPLRKDVADDEGAEGHAARFKGALPKDEDDDGSEGHGVRIKI